MKRTLSIFWLFSFFIMHMPVQTQTLEAPENLAAALLIKLSAFEKTVSSSGNVIVYVLGAPKVAAELQKIVGETIGQSKLALVLFGDKLPEEKPNILFIGSSTRLVQALAYSRKNKILTVTGIPDLVKEGVTLGIGVGNDGKPKVILNLNSTIEENLLWNPAIMKVARTIK